MQFFQRKRYRFFYPAGLISLVLLPALSYVYFYYKPIVEQKYSIELNTYSPDQTKDHPDLFPDPIIIRNYFKIYLTGEKRHDSLNLIYAQLVVRQILSKKDTVNGVQIIYGPKAKYASFIETLNICLKENARSYTPYKDSFLILYYELNPNYQKALLSSVCGTPEVQAYYDRLFREANEAKYKQTHPDTKNLLLKSSKHFWPAGILYLIMVALTIQKVAARIWKPANNF